MTAANPTVAHVSSGSQRVASGNAVLAKAAGVAGVALVTALFWVALTALSAKAAGIPVTAQTLGGLGGAIALFITSVCAPLMMRR